MSEETDRGPHGYCLACEAKIEAAKHMDLVPVCSKCVDVMMNTTAKQTAQGDPRGVKRDAVWGPRPDRRDHGWPPLF